MTLLPRLLKHCEQHAVVSQAQLEGITRRYPFLLRAGLRVRYPVSWRQLTQFAKVRAANEPFGLGPFSKAYSDITKQLQYDVWGVSMLPWPVSMSEDLKGEILRGLGSTTLLTSTLSTELFFSCMTTWSFVSSGRTSTRSAWQAWRTTSARSIHYSFRINWRIRSQIRRSHQA